MGKCDSVSTDIVKEVETCKDVIWYLKGQIDLAKKEDVSDFPFDKEHIRALEDMVAFIMEVKRR